MQKRRVIINAAMSVAQVACIGVIIFILYKFLLKTIGAKELGIWSLILSTASLTQVANFGLSGSVVKFVAKYVAQEKHQDASSIIQTAAISLGVLVGIILLISYPLIKHALGFIVAGGSLPLAIGILPYALLSFWLMIVVSVFQSALDGCQRIDLRSFILTGSAILNLVLCILLAPSYGLMGVAYARVGQMLVTLLIAWLVLKRYIKLPLIPCRWSRRSFREMLGYGLKYQTISITTMFYDPVTKALLSKFGSLSMVAYYEMASRMVQQFRALIVSANQALFPAIADLKEKEPDRIGPVYKTSYKLIFYLSLPLFSSIMVSLPLISWLWIGHYESIFVTFGLLLAAGWFMNTLDAPAYFANLGTGELGWNLAGHVSIAVLNIILGLCLGIFMGGIGVVVGWVISLALGSSLIYLSYHVKNKIHLAELLPKESTWIIMISVLGLFCAILWGSTINRAALFAPLFFVFILAGLWFHPMRKRLIGWIGQEVLSRSMGIPEDKVA